MLLFDDIDFSKNLLPKDGVVNYYGKLLNQKEDNYYFDRLLNNIEWKNDQAIMYGKLITTKRKVAWYGDSNFEYIYSKTRKLALPWTSDLLALKSRVEEKSGETFNSCLLNLYHSGDEGMGWHSDDEKNLLRNGAIASLSLGVDRKFQFKHKKTMETVSIMLETGSLLVMKDSTQTYWLHKLPPTKTVSKPRINLTFRTIIS